MIKKPKKINTPEDEEENNNSEEGEEDSQLEPAPMAVGDPMPPSDDEE